MNTWRKPKDNYITQVARALQAGVTVLCDKTKPVIGRKHVSAGKRRVAVPDHYKYMVIIGQDEIQCLDARTAAKEFLSYVGNDKGWDATVRAVQSARDSGIKFELRFK